MFGCLPSQLDNENADTIDIMREINNAIQKEAKKEMKRAEQKVNLR